MGGENLSLKNRTPEFQVDNRKQCHIRFIAFGAKFLESWVPSSEIADDETWFLIYDTKIYV